MKHANQNCTRNITKSTDHINRQFLVFYRGSNNHFGGVANLTRICNLWSAKGVATLKLQLPDYDV